MAAPPPELQPAPAVHAPDGSRSWAVAFAAAWNIFFCSLLRRAMPAMYQPVGEAFATTARGGVAWINALIYTLTYTPVLVVSGLSHRMSLRLLSVVGAVLIGAGQIACFLLDSLMLIIPVLACCVGLGSALSTVVDETAVHLHFSTARRRRAYNLYYTAFSLSAIASPLLISTLVDKYGLNGALLLSGAVSLNALAGSMLMNRPSWMSSDPLPSIYRPTHTAGHGPPRAEFPHASRASVVGDGSSAHSGGAGAAGVAPDPEAGAAAGAPPEPSVHDGSVRVILMAHCALTSSTVTAASVIYDHATGGDRDRAAGAISVLLMFGAGDLLGRLAYDVLARTASQLRKVMALQAFLQGGVLFLMAVAKEQAILMPICFGLGWLTSSLDMLPLPVLQRFLEPDSVGRQFVLCRATSGLSCLVGPVLVSTFRDGDQKSYAFVFIVSGALSLLAGALWIPGIKKEMAEARGKAAGATEAAAKPLDASVAQASGEQAVAAGGVLAAEPAPDGAAATVTPGDASAGAQVPPADAPPAPS